MLYEKMDEKIDKQLQKHLNWWQEKNRNFKGEKKRKSIEKIKKMNT